MGTSSPGTCEGYPGRRTWQDDRVKGTEAADSRALDLRPIWWITLGYPLWWILGVTEFAVLTACGILGYRLFHARRSIVLPKGAYLWLLFLAWVVVGVVLLQVAAPGTQSGFQATRYITWAFRLAWYLAATVVLVYVFNVLRTSPVERVMKAFGAMFFTLVLGGFLGSLFPEVELRSVLELVLPPSVANIESVRDLIHPTLAQTYTFEGTFNPRPSAPFPYTNDWGVTYACTLPLFVVGWIVRAAGSARLIGIFTLAASTVPVVLSQNRGLWLALLAMLVFVGVKFLSTGHFRALAIASVASVVVIAVVLMSPLAQVFENRVSSEGGSDQGRQALGTATVVTVLERAPISGLGTTRTATSSFSSISLADSASCARCTPPALGTQGQIWLVIFSQGAVGLVLYLAFLLGHLLGSIRQVGAPSIASMAVVIGHLATMPFYNAIGPALLMIFVSCAVLAARGLRDAQQAATLAGLLAGLRARSRVILAAVVVGGTVGFLWQIVQAPRVTVSTLIYLPATPGSVIEPARLDNLDLAAAMTRAAVGQPTVQRAGTAESGDIVVSAIPNSRVIVLSYTDTDAVRARDRTDAAAEALLEVRTETQDELLAADTEVADRAAVAYAQALSTLPDGRTNKQRELETQLSDLQARGIELRTSQGEDVGAIVGHTVQQLVRDDRLVTAVSGALVGLILGSLASGRLEVGRRGLRKRESRL